MAKYETHERGRDAITGRIIPVDVAERRSRTAVVETYKVGKKTAQLSAFQALRGRRGNPAAFTS